MNESAALALLLERGRLTRSQLRALTGLSKPTVSEALRRLAEAELAVVVGHVSGGPGPNAEVYAANPDAATVAAVSVRAGTDRPALAGAVCDLAGAVRARLEHAADLRRADPVDALDELLGALLRTAGRARVDRVHLGVAGAYDSGTGTIHHVDVPGFDRPGLVGEIADRLGTDIAVDNDVNLAAIAERRHGVARGAESFALVWFGEGLGLAIDLGGGGLLRGARGGAGEIGYLPLYPLAGPADPPATRVGDLQDLVGGDAVMRLAARHGHRARTPEEAVAVGAADPGFLSALAARMAVALAPVVAVLDPPLVVLAGPVALAGGGALRDAVAAAMPSATPLETTIEVTAVSDDAVLLGALDAGLAAVRNRLLAGIHPTR